MSTSESIFDEIADTDTVGSRIFRARDASGIPTGKIAKALGIRKSTVEAWENDRSAPRAHHLVRIAGMVGVSPSWLLGGVGEAPGTNGVSEEVRVIRKQLGGIRTLFEQTAIAMDNMETALARLEKKEVGQS